MRTRVGALVGVLALLVTGAGAPSTADACGLPPSVAFSKAPKRTIARTAHPSRVLLVSTKAAVLKRDLAAAGHHVDAAPSSTNASGQYAVVVVDSNAEADKARERFKGTGTQVFVRSGDNREDLKSVESHVAARWAPATSSIAMRKQKQLDAKKKEEPLKAGGGSGTQSVVVDAKLNNNTVLDVAVSQPVVSSALMSEEIVFSRGSARVAGSNQTIEKAVKWLSANPNARVTIEGHADPTGTPEGNLALGRVRAETVRDELVAAGVASSRIDVVTYGDTRLKYGTTDGRNRRVVIEAKR